MVSLRHSLCFVGVPVYFLIDLTKKPDKKHLSGGGVLWLTVRGDSVHQGGGPVRKQGEMDAGAQLAFFFFLFSLRP